ncbi:hypothetical protein [Gracilibacillus alcaliphilus]|uniref:hypothetical protein n=1 Tax=Gracilibacillus alcaliphilus TaxID=1401441 RepID=UPI00195DAAF4|nr:hypothetical protein [Gracilibacillus alcaliphilus]MBM7676726.1 site-specific recombinase XerD [Gracilibacillus alcaliphilus]
MIRATRATHLIAAAGGKLDCAGMLLNHKDTSTTFKHADLNEKDEDLGTMF